MITMTLSTIMNVGTTYSIILNGLSSPPSMGVYTSSIFNLSVANPSGALMYSLLTASISPLTILNTLTVISSTFSTQIIVNTYPSTITPTLDVQLSFSTPLSSQFYSLQIELPFILDLTASLSPIITGTGICKSSLS